MLPSADELKRLKAVTGVDLESLKEPQLPVHRRKVAKGPNPLSVRKKKPEPLHMPQKTQTIKKAVDPPKPSESVAKADDAPVQTKAKRKRRRPGKKIDSVDTLTTNACDGSDDAAPSETKKPKIE